MSKNFFANLSRVAHTIHHKIFWAGVVFHTTDSSVMWVSAQPPMS